jgi:hypothetical protein
VRANPRWNGGVVCAMLVAMLQACGPQATRAGAPADSSVVGRKRETSVPNDQPCRPARTGAELTEAAAQLPERRGSEITPVFPLRWPQVGSGVGAFVYQIDIPGTGRRTRRVSGPTHRITFETLGAVPSVEQLADAPLLGTEDSGDAPAADFAERMSRAVDAMAEVIGGCRTPESARADLEPYSTWLSRYRLMAGDLRQRTPAFIEWLSQSR